MAYITCWLALVLAIFIPPKSYVASEECSELSVEPATEELLAALCSVSGHYNFHESSKVYSYMDNNII